MKFDGCISSSQISISVFSVLFLVLLEREMAAWHVMQIQESFDWGAVYEYTS